MNLTTDPISLIRRGAKALCDVGDASSAYALYELANNLLILMKGEADLEDWSKVYDASGNQPLNPEKVISS